MPDRPFDVARGGSGASDPRRARIDAPESGNPPRQRIIRARRQYNQWVASQTLEDYALRFTARQARRSSFRVGNTAFGPIAFLACEAIGGAITLSYGFSNAAGAI